MGAMSKAFIKESGAEADVEDEIPAPPAGTKNYITPEGLQRLHDEFAQLQKIERPKTVETVSWAAGNGDRSENGDYIYGKRRLP
jgi:transcription elongation factor GreB